MRNIIIIGAILAVGLGIVFYNNIPDKKKHDLPILNPIDIDESVVDPELLRIGQGHTIGDFKFQNQEGKWITRQDVAGKVFVAEYFFTTCKTICPIMTMEMERVAEKFKGNKDVKILSFTVDPENDDVEQMKRYADSHQADANQWHFLTGEKTELYALARKSFFLLKPAEAENLGDAGSDFIHTNNFVLVDKKGRIRGYYDGTNSNGVDHLMRDIHYLLEE